MEKTQKRGPFHGEIDRNRERRGRFLVYREEKSGKNGNFFIKKAASEDLALPPIDSFVHNERKFDR